MLQVVNIAFLARNWAETHVESGIAATPSVTDHLDASFNIVQTTEVNFQGIDYPIRISELYHPHAFLNRKERS